MKVSHYSNFKIFRVDYTPVILIAASIQDILYPYGSGHRDLETPKMDDGSSPEVVLLIPFIFFNIPYRSIYVSLAQTFRVINCMFLP